jgi:glycerol-3-phosphate dehydrogenase
VTAATREMGPGVPPSLTRRLPVLGAVRYHEMWSHRRDLARRSGLTQPAVERLLRRYGALATDVLRLIREDPGLGEPLDGAEAYLPAEIVYAATHEGALHLDDLLERRTRISIETADRGVRAAEPVAGLVAPLLGWDAATVRREIDGYRARVDAARAGEEALDDESALRQFDRVAS